MEMKILDQIDRILSQIPLISDYPVKGINCLLPCDTSKDIKVIFPALLNELKNVLSEEMGGYDSDRFSNLLEQEFKR